jgi:hypothetical protein
MPLNSIALTMPSVRLQDKAQVQTCHNCFHSRCSTGKSKPSRDEVYAINLALLQHDGPTVVKKMTPSVSCPPSLHAPKFVLFRQYHAANWDGLA